MIGQFGSRPVFSGELCLCVQGSCPWSLDGLFVCVDEVMMSICDPEYLSKIQ